MRAPSSLFVLSSHIGKNLDLVQGAGGNTSYKDKDILWVKASGFWLSEADEKNIFVAVKYKAILERLKNNEKDPVTPEIIKFGDKQLRPSIETSLHALMPHRYVVHTHSVNTLANVVLKNGKISIANLLKGLRWEWIPYVRPGLPLTRKVQKAIESRPDVIILANHGVVFGANSVNKITKLMSDFEKRVSRVIRSVAIKTNSLNHDKMQCHSEYMFIENMMIKSLAFDHTALSILSTGTLYPDHVVFLGAGPICVFNIHEFEDYIEALRKNTVANIEKVVVVKDVGVFLLSSLKKGCEEMLHCLANVLLRLDINENLRYLTTSEETELLGWDAEKYRQNVKV